MQIKDRSGYLVRVDFEYMHSICKKYLCSFGDFSFLLLQDPLSHCLVESYDLVFDSAAEREDFIMEFNVYQREWDLDGLVGSWDMTRE